MCLSIQTSSLLFFLSNELISLTLFVSLSCQEPKLTFTSFAGLRDATFGTETFRLCAFFQNSLDLEATNVLKALTDENRILMPASRRIRNIIIRRAKSPAFQSITRTLGWGSSP
jgi:hypothetical protein